MEAHDFFLQLAVLLFSARIFGEVAVRLKAPSVLGEMFAGILLGPSLLGIYEVTAVIKLLAAIGIILLLFEVGLETDMQRLLRTGLRSLAVAVAGFVAPLVVGFLVAHYAFHLPLLPSLFTGGTLTATSIGITVRVLADLQRQHSRESQIVLGAAVIDDILGVVLLTVLYEYSVGGGVGVTTTTKAIVFITLFLLLAPIAAKALARVVKVAEKRSEIPGMIPGIMMSIVLFFSWGAHKVGAPELLGGFAAGLALSRQFFLPFATFLHADKPFANHVEREMRSITHLFTPIFFVMVGLSLNLRAVDWSSPRIWMLTAVLIVVAFAGKLAGGFILPREKPAARWAIGLAMVPRGEVGLIFAELGHTTGIVADELYAALILVIATTTLLPPFILRWFHVRGPGAALAAE